MGNSVQELLDMLYNLVTDAWAVPLGANKCVIERDKILDLLDEIKGQLPTELSEAQRLVAARTEFINSAKREADTMRKNAEEQARQLVDEQNIVKEAREKANRLISAAEEKSAELRRVANEYADDALRRTEDAISEAYREVHNSRANFRSAAAAVTPSPEFSLDEERE